MKSNVLISCVVNPQLICAFVFVNAKNRSSHDAVHTAIEYDRVMSRLLKLYFPMIPAEEIRCVFDDI